jgi:hypothetical protein
MTNYTGPSKSSEKKGDVPQYMLLFRALRTLYLR